CMLGRSRTSSVSTTYSSGCTRSTVSAATTTSPAATANGTHGSTTYRNPPVTGPKISAACHVADCRAVNQGSLDGATVSAGRERVAGVAKARAVPNTTTRAKRGNVDVGFVLAYAVIATSVSASSVMLTAARRRRSTRSATVPVTKTRSAAGANSANP